MKKDRTQDKFLQELEKIPIIQVACERIGLSRQTVYRWRKEDSLFANEMDQALADGDKLLNDVAESQLFVLVKEKHFPAIKYRLEKRHPKYMKAGPEKEKATKLDMDEIIKELELVDTDFMEENYGKTLMRITEYLRDIKRP